MTDHKIIAAPWQLEAAAQGRLGTVIMPYPKELITREGQWYFHEWIRDEPTTCSIAVGDRLYLAEEWTWVEGYTHPDHSEWVQEGPISQSLFFGAYNGSVDDDAIADGWQPAETMPPEAAQYWYEVTGVRVVQAQKITELDCEKAMGLTLNAFGNFAYKRLKSAWNAAHTDYTWADDRWVVLIEVKSVSNAA